MGEKVGERFLTLITGWLLQLPAQPIMAAIQANRIITHQGFCVWEQDISAAAYPAIALIKRNHGCPQPSDAAVSDALNSIHNLTFFKPDSAFFIQ